VGLTPKVIKSNLVPCPELPKRLDRFEVAVISIDWMVLLVNGLLLAFVFSRQHHRERSTI
jgi:hypothetical protein